MPGSAAVWHCLVYAAVIHVIMRGHSRKIPVMLCPGMGFCICGFMNIIRIRIVVSDSSIEEISKVVYGEAGVIHSYDALLGVAQCIYDMWKSGQFGQTVTEASNPAAFSSFTSFSAFSRLLKLPAYTRNWLQSCCTEFVLCPKYRKKLVKTHKNILQCGKCMLE